MMNADRLREAGVDYDAGLKRFLDDPALYEAVLTAFAGEDTLERARAAYLAHDPERLMKAVHEAKGSGGNAGLDAVYVAAGALVALLRSQSYTEDELAASFRRFESVYSEIQNGIRIALK